MPVVTPAPGNEYGSVAATIADRRGERVSTDLEETGDGNLLYVVAPDSLSEHAILALQRRLFERGPDAGAFGIITGLTPELAISLYEREVQDDGTHCVLLRKEDRDIRSPDDTTLVLTREDATVDRLRDVVDDGMASLSTMTDGQSIHTFLTDGYICGFPTDADVTDYDGSQPNCVEAGERDCPLDGELIPVENLAVPHVFLNSCASMVPSNSSHGLPVHVGMGLLRGAASLVGGYRPMHGLPQETALHHALLRAGYTAAERCDLLNRNAHATNLKPLPYATFGRPGITVSDPKASRGTVDVRSGDLTAVRCHDVSAHVIDFRIPSDAAGDARPLLENSLEAHADWPLFYTTFQDSGGMRVLVYSWGRIQAEELRFRVLPDGSRSADRAVMRSSLANARKLDRLGLLDRKARGQVKSLRNRVDGLAEQQYRQEYHANAYRDVSRRLDGVLDDVENLGERLLAILERRGPGFLSEDYDDRVRKTDVKVATTDCYDCGRPVFETSVADATGVVERCLGFCAYCINVYDVPALGAGNPTHPVVHGDLTLSTPACTEIAIEFTNPRDHHVDAIFYPWLWSNWDEHRGESVFIPESTTARLEPGETRTETFELDVGPLNPGTYSVYGYVLGNLEVYLSCRKLVVSGGD